MYEGFFLLGSVVWFVCAYLAYKTAGQKHRRPLTWGILGIFFGPLAFAAVFMMPPGNLPAHNHQAAAAAPEHGHSAGSTHAPSHGQTQAQADNYEVPHKH